MLKRFLQSLSKLFRRFTPEEKKSSVKYGDKVGNVTIEHPYQLIKHTEYKTGESYRVGEMIVTLHANKASMQKAIAKVDAARKAREERLTRRAEDIMLMTPDELQQFKIKEWLANRTQKHSIIQRIMGKGSDNKRYIAPNKDAFTPPSGKVSERFEELIKDVVKEEDKEKVS